MLLSHIKELANIIGPRPACSDAEKRAAQYARKQLDSFGCDTSFQEFPALRTYSWLHFFHYLIFFVAFALLNAAPVVSLVISAIALTSYVLNVCSRRSMAALFPKGTSVSTLGFRLPRKPALAKVIISAHIDTSRSALFFHPKLVGRFKATFRITLFVMLINVATAAIFSAGASPGWLFLLTGIMNLQLLAAALMLVDREVRGKFTNGAADNASGVAAMLGAAELLADKKFKFTEIEFLADGAEESGLFGMVNHMEKNWHDPQRTYIINIDHVGAGNISVTQSEGMLVKKPTDPELRSIASGFKLPSTGEPARAIDFDTMLNDSYAALMRGFKAVSIMAFHPGGVLPNWHWHTDTTEHISEDNLQDAAALAAFIVEKIEEKAILEAEG